MFTKRVFFPLALLSSISVFAMAETNNQTAEQTMQNFLKSDSSVKFISNFRNNASYQKNLQPALKDFLYNARNGAIDMRGLETVIINNQPTKKRNFFILPATFIGGVVTGAGIGAVGGLVYLLYNFSVKK